MRLSCEKENGTARVRVSGRVDTTTSGDLRDALLAGVVGAERLVVDFAGVEYISSAGLRALLLAKKRCGDEISMEITNVSPEVKNVFDTTGFTDVIDIKTPLREVSVEGCEPVGAGACGECFRLDDETIVKLYYERVSDDEIEREKRLAKIAFVLGLPTAISYDVVMAGGRKGVIYELLNAKTLAALYRDDYAEVERYTAMYAELCHLIHSTNGSGRGLPDFKDINRADIKNVSGITDGEREALYRFLELVPEAETCVHGDVNPNNIMTQDGELCFIDMGELSTGFAMFDISRLMFTFVYAVPRDGSEYKFLGLTPEQCDEIWRLFLLDYFGADTLEGAARLNADAAWVEPLAQFRCVTSMLKGSRWPDDKRALAMSLLKERLIPLIEKGGV